MFLYSVVFSLLVVVFGSMIWFLNGHDKHKRFILPVILASTFIWFAVGLFLVMGHARPITWISQSKLSKAVIVGYLYHPGKAIFIWVTVDRVPIALVMPWKKKTAEELQRKMKWATKSGKKLKIQMTQSADQTSPRSPQRFKLVPRKLYPAKANVPRKPNPAKSIQ